MTSHSHQIIAINRKILRTGKSGWCLLIICKFSLKESIRSARLGQNDRDSLDMTRQRRFRFMLLVVIRVVSVTGKLF